MPYCGHIPVVVVLVAVAGGGGAPGLAAAVGVIGDRVWHDSNWNGIQDGGETGVPAVVVRLFEGGTDFAAATTTDVSGQYIFTNVLVGTYRIQALNPDPPHAWFTDKHAGTNGTADSDVDADGLSEPVYVGAGTVKRDVDAGLQFLVPRVAFAKRAGNAPSGKVLHVPPGSPVVYTYTATNTGNTWFSPFQIADDQLGLVGGIDPPNALNPGQIVTFAVTTTVFAATTNFAEACGTPTDAKGGSLNIPFECPNDIAVVEMGDPELYVVGGPAVPGGSFVVWFSGVPGATYSVEAARGTPDAPWQAITNLVAPAGDQGFGAGSFPVREPAGLATTRFYRLLLPAS